MRQFTDDQGTTWTLELTIGELPRIEAETGVHLLRLDRPVEDGKEKWVDDDGEPLSGFVRLELDLSLMYKLVHSLCRDQIRELGMSDKEFDRRIGNACDSAHDALFGELRDFFHKSRQTRALATVVEKYQQMIKQAQTDQLKKAEQIDMAQAMQELKPLQHTTSGQTSGEPQDALA